MTVSRQDVESTLRAADIAAYLATSLGQTTSVIAVAQPVAWGQTITAADLVEARIAADPALLAELAELSGGTVTPPEQLSTLLDRWLVEPPGRERLTVSRRVALWDNAWLLVAFVALIGTEWFVRKRSGLV